MILVIDGFFCANCQLPLRGRTMLSACQQLFLVDEEQARHTGLFSPAPAFFQIQVESSVIKLLETVQ